MFIQSGKASEKEEESADMGLKLSIIVPVYKVEPYLQKCVDSLLAQDLPEDDYEIILVDDGSPDRCPEICDEYATEHQNIRVIHRENGGLSAARNSGIAVARGVYVQFVDSDDYLEPNVLKTLVAKMDADRLDVLRFNYQNVNEQGEVFEPNKVSKPFVDYRDEICDGLVFLTERLGYGCYAWQFILRRELLGDCRFREGIYFEDSEWTPRMLVKAKRVTSTPLMVYNYLMRKDSITQSVDMGRKRKALEDKIQLIDSLQSQMKGVADTRWYQGLIAQLTIGIITSIGRLFYEDRKQYLRQIKEKHVFPLYPFHATRFVKRKVFIANVSPMLFCVLLHIRSTLG
jgi:glycosyltransferase involved in cell wall biosynthesis